MERIFQRRARLDSCDMRFSATIFHRQTDDERAPSVQVCFDMDSGGVRGVQSGITFYVESPQDLHNLAQQLNCAAVALECAKKFYVKEGE